MALTDPDQVTAHLRLRKIYQRQRHEAGPGNTSTEDLLAEVDIVIRLLQTEEKVCINLMGEEVRKSLERQG